MRFHRRSAIVTTLALTALPLPVQALAAQSRDQAKSTTTVTTSTSSSAHPSAPSTTTTSTTSTRSTSTSISTHSASTATSPAQHGNSARVHHTVKDKHTGANGLSFNVKKSRRAHAASDPPVTIANFAFSPALVTIKVGDTITWTNNDAIAHTATGSGFDTGTLQKGQSGSHTFTTAGTFAYICSIHPNMHGTVVVQASSSGNGNGSGTGSGSGSGGTGGTSGTGSTPSGSGAITTTPATASAPSLPNTGTDLSTTLLVGALMIGTGLAVRRVAVRRRIHNR